MNDFVIIANGPFLEQSIIEEASCHRNIIALDGAANKLKTLDIEPDVILGDFDSLNEDTRLYWGIHQIFDDITSESKPYYGHHNVLIVPIKDQNKTDLEKGIDYCDAQKATKISILCASGGREDHHEGAKVALLKAYKPSREVIIHTEYQSLKYAKNETIELTGEVGDYCGVIALNTGHCTSQGLEYECNQDDISLCNRLKQSPAILQIVGSALIIMPPQLRSQRIFDSTMNLR